MNTIFNLFFKQLLITMIVFSSCLISVSAIARDRVIDHTFDNVLELDKGNFSNTNQPKRRLKPRSSYKQLQWAQNSQSRFLSKSDVVRAVKKRYNARVLKITFNESQAMYKVRVLMPSGKIKNINMSARP